MKQRKKTIYIVAAMMAICVAAVLLFGNDTECCLCNAPTSSALCLVDLETGDILELCLDGPSTTYDGNGQSDVETFSFIRFGNITGTKQTAPDIIELKIPVDGAPQRLALCRQCRQLLPRGYNSRYVLADVGGGVLFPITVGAELTIHSLQIAARQSAEGILVTVYQSLCSHLRNN